MTSAPDVSDITTRVEYVTAMMLTYDCDYDKKASHYVIFAEVRPLNQIDPGSRGNVTGNRMRHTFYLPEIEGVMEPSFVDLRRIDRVFKPVVAAKAAAGERIASLDDEALEALQFQIAVFFGFDRDTVGNAPRPVS